MGNLSEDTWSEIKANQELALIGSTTPGEGNGYHDAMSWRVPYDYDDSQKKRDVFSSTFISIYMRDLGSKINPNLLRKNNYLDGLKFENCTENYLETFELYFGQDRYGRDNITSRLGEWAERLCYRGRLIFEIKGWFDNDSNQFYGFELLWLDNEYCKVRSKHVVFKAPTESGEIKRVKISRRKCVIIDFPKERGGYKGFLRKVKKVRMLGSQYNFDPNNPGGSLDYSKNWDKQYNKILGDWGAPNNHLEVSEYYKMYSEFKFAKMGIYCNDSLINGLKDVISYLNDKLEEEANLSFNVKEYDIGYFEEMEKKWSNGELSFKDANKVIQLQELKL